MNKEQIKQAIQDGKTALGIELGSTRIKAALIGENHDPIASGGFDWENRLENGVWTYALDDVWRGLQTSFRNLCDNVESQYGVPLTTVGALGISGMMHGYLVFGQDGKQLVPFRTWRNTITEEAADKLTEAFRFNIPQRWSVAHVYQAILKGESHVRDIALLTTLSSYVHWKLTGVKAVGVGEASGMFPVDSAINQFDKARLEIFNRLVADQVDWKLEEIFPQVLSAGDAAGTLTPEGAKLLDPTGRLQPGIPMCPPEGDAGTGMVATGSVAPRTGNVSAGTSIFAMIVLENALSRVYPEIDMITTPSGSPVAMVHCNNCTSDLDAWVKLFREVGELCGAEVSQPALYDALYNIALQGDADGGGMVSYNYFAGEHMTGFDQGRPLLARLPDSQLTLANFMRTILYSTMGTLKLGMDILTQKERVHLDQLLGHGGLFKTKGVGQRLMAGALGVPMAVMESAGEGGAWGIALLAAYMHRKQPGETLEAYLANRVFTSNAGERMEPDAKITQGFEAYMKRYAEGLAIERAAVDHLH